MYVKARLDYMIVILDWPYAIAKAKFRAHYREIALHMLHCLVPKDEHACKRMFLWSHAPKSTSNNR